MATMLQTPAVPNESLTEEQSGALPPQNQTHPETNRRLGEIASAFFKTDNKSEGVPRLLQKIIDLKCKMKLPFTFRDLGITIDKSDIRRLFAKSLSDPKMSNNILPMTEDMIVNILELKQ